MAGAATSVVRFTIAGCQSRGASATKPGLSHRLLRRSIQLRERKHLRRRVLLAQNLLHAGNNVRMGSGHVRCLRWVAFKVVKFERLLGAWRVSSFRIQRVAHALPITHADGLPAVIGGKLAIEE